MQDVKILKISKLKPGGIRLTSVLLSLGLMALALSGAAARLQADSPPLLTLDPWVGSEIAQTWDHPMEENKAWIRNDGQSAHIFWYNSYGRIRFQPDNAYSPAIGYRMMYVDLGTHSPLLPEQLTDQSLVLGAHLIRNSRWDLGVVLGGGYSGNSPFGDSRAYYGLGHIQLGRRISPEDQFDITLDYVGNGGLMPDVPLPGFAWEHRGKKSYWRLGYPTDDIHLHPLPRIQLIGYYEAPIDARAEVSYRIIKGLYGFADFQNYFEGFTINTYPDHQRLFMEFSRIEAGIRVIHEPLFDISVALGYAFNQEFMRGFDIRSLQPQAQIADAPYVAFLIRGKF